MTFYTPLEGTIGVMGGIELAEFREHLFPDTIENLPVEVTGGTPVNLLCKELLRRGRRVVLLSLHPSIESERVFEGKRLKIYLGPFRPRGILNLFKEERKFLTQAMGREKLAFLHANWTYEYALAAVDSGLPHVLTAHDAPLNCFRLNFSINPFEIYNRTQTLQQVARNNAFWIARTLIAFKAARSAQRLVAVSPYLVNHLRRHGFHNRPIEVIPNGMPADYFERARRREPGGPIVFATALGSWSRLKNPAPAIEAFAKVRRVLPDAEMLMFGGGYAADGPAAAWARERGWDGGIEFKGQVPNVQVIDLFSRSVDVLVHPSLEEAHPMPLIEAMSLGIPPIAGSSTGGVPWTLGHGKYGILVDVRSPDQLASAMLQLAQGDEGRMRLGMTARESVRRRFHIEQVADRYEAIYAQLAAHRVSQR
jgi:glycosyltransferase involved in cell wall biosynthesis